MNTKFLISEHEQKSYAVHQNRPVCSNLPSSRAPVSMFDFWPTPRNLAVGIFPVLFLYVWSTKPTCRLIVEMM